MLVSASLALWFSFGLAYYAYYGFPPLGVFWYFVSFMIILAAAVFLFKRFRSSAAAKNCLVHELK
jgi:ABC-type polysaccharide/polyol phosphate export permease